MANDLHWPRWFNSTGTQTFVIDAFHLETNYVDSITADHQPTAFSILDMAIQKDYSGSDTALKATYPRRMISEQLTSIESAIQGIHTATSVASVLKLNTAYCWLDFDRLWPVAHTQVVSVHLDGDAAHGIHVGGVTANTSMCWVLTESIRAYIEKYTAADLPGISGLYDMTSGQGTLLKMVVSWWLMQRVVVDLASTVVDVPNNQVDEDTCPLLRYGAVRLPDTGRRHRPPIPDESSTSSPQEQKSDPFRLFVKTIQSSLGKATQRSNSFPRFKLLPPPPSPSQPPPLDNVPPPPSRRIQSLPTTHSLVDCVTQIRSASVAELSLACNVSTAVARQVVAIANTCIPQVPTTPPSTRTTTSSSSTTTATSSPPDQIDPTTKDAGPSFSSFPPPFNNPEDVHDIEEDSPAFRRILQDMDSISATAHGRVQTIVSAAAAVIQASQVFTAAFRHFQQAMDDTLHWWTNQNESDDDCASSTPRQSFLLRQFWQHMEEDVLSSHVAITDALNVHVITSWNQFAHLFLGDEYARRRHKLNMRFTQYHSLALAYAMTPLANDVMLNMEAEGQDRVLGAAHDAFESARHDDDLLMLEPEVVVAHLSSATVIRCQTAASHQPSPVHRQLRYGFQITNNNNERSIASTWQADTRQSLDKWIQALTFNHDQSNLGSTVTTTTHTLPLPTSSITPSCPPSSPPPQREAESTRQHNRRRDESILVFHPPETSADSFHEIVRHTFPCSVQSYLQRFVQDPSFSKSFLAHERATAISFTSWQLVEPHQHQLQQQEQDETSCYTRRRSCVLPVESALTNGTSRIDGTDMYQVVSDPPSCLRLLSSDVSVDVPYGSYFTVQSCTTVTRTNDDNDDQCQVVVTVGVYFIKHTMFRRMIEQACVTEATRSFERLAQHMLAALQAGN
ncbi:hypothetical protein DYB31_008472 [Aphanomyces astaci]|uniref:VASt domain-containing protein n=1 Tax=Aphanomyces astaci TaxID=112090 RepID=A0A397EMJ1_APHAT|nr:hypothetical protein DYB31_008472 [Aphanomyces astaci]